MGWGENGAARATTEEYRNNKFWDKGKKDAEVDAKKEPTKREGTAIPCDDGKTESVGEDGSGRGNKNNGDDAK